MAKGCGHRKVGEDEDGQEQWVRPKKLKRSIIKAERIKKKQRLGWRSWEFRLSQSVRVEPADLKAWNRAVPLKTVGGWC